MTSWRDRITEMMTELQQERDELRVKLALGKAELKDELAELDGKLDELKGKAAEWADKAEDEIEDMADEARERASGWLGELKEGYQKLRNRVSGDEPPAAGA